MKTNTEPAETNFDTDEDLMSAVVPQKQGVLAWIISALILVLYVYAVVAAVGNFLGMRVFASSLGSGLSVSGWFWLTLSVLLPVLLAALAVLLYRKTRVALWLLLLAGLGLLAVSQIEIVHLIPQTSFIAT
jgi:uncharacterized membrane protein (DUF485 family)